MGGKYGVNIPEQAPHINIVHLQVAIFNFPHLLKVVGSGNGSNRRTAVASGEQLHARHWVLNSE